MVVEDETEQDCRRKRYLPSCAAGFSGGTGAATIGRCTRTAVICDSWGQVRSKALSKAFLSLRRIDRLPDQKASQRWKHEGESAVGGLGDFQKW